MTALSGRYVLYHAGVECVEERWRIDGAEGGMVLSGEQETMPPHPFPNHHAYRVTLTRAWRITGLEVLWTVGSHTVRATHGADGAMWRVRIEYGGHVREQEGDFPDYCEVDYATHLFNTLILARRDFQFLQVSQAGHLSGVRDMPTGLKLRIKPYGLAGMRDTAA